MTGGALVYEGVLTGAGTGGNAGGVALTALVGVHFLPKGLKFVGTAAGAAGAVYDGVLLAAAGEATAGVPTEVLADGPHFLPTTL